MLSRIAESLFWIGRYTERAEATARLLQVHLRLLVEDPSASESDSCRNLLALMGVDADAAAGADQGGEVHTEDLLRILGDDHRQPSSIVSCWQAARDNARRAREVIPAEVWECINTTWHQLPSGRIGPGGPDHFFDWAKERSAQFRGLATGSMVRDDGWQHLVLGQSLERADMSSRLIASASLSSGPTPWPAALRGCGAYDAFLRTYRGFHADREAAEFLIVDPRFPRSVMHGLAQAIEQLEALTPADDDRHPAREALHELGRLRAHLQYTDMADLLADLHATMASVQDTCDTTTKIISATFFAGSTSPVRSEGTA